MNTQHITQFFADNQQLIMVCVVSMVAICTLLAFNDTLRRKNKVLRLEKEDLKAQLGWEQAVSKSTQKDLEDIHEMIIDFNKAHKRDLEAQANIADANIKRLQEENHKLKDRHRITALDKALHECPHTEQIIPLAKEIYKFLIGK